MESKNKAPLEPQQLDTLLLQVDQAMQTAPNDDVWVDNFLVWLELHSLRWGRVDSSHNEQQPSL